MVCRWGGVFNIWTLSRPPSAGPRSAGPPLRWTPLSQAPLRKTPLSRTAQNFAFFSLSRHNVHSFLPSLGGPFVKFWRPCTCGLSGSKRGHSRVRALQTPPKFHERIPKRGEKERSGGRGKKKGAKFWAPHPSGPHSSGPRPPWPEAGTPVQAKLA